MRLRHVMNLGDEPMSLVLSVTTEPRWLPLPHVINFLNASVIFDVKDV